VEEQLNDEDKIRLMEPLSEMELAVAIDGMKSESAPGPK
jgi:hypothetical protein